MHFDPSAEPFWDATELDRELRRVFDVCHGCRRCLPLCPSFPALFDFIDEHDGEAQQLSSAQINRVVDLCYQCKLCYNHCPYTPPHHWDVDFPRLMLRARAVQGRQNGIRLQDRMLGDVDRMGKLGTTFAPLANWALNNRTHRSLMEKVLGIEKTRKLPSFSRQRFSQWFHQRPAARPTPAPQAREGKVVLFSTCSVEYNNPEIGKAAVAVLEKNGQEVQLPEQRCCGMPFLDGGDMKSAVESVQYNLARLVPWLEKGYSVVAPGPTCSYMLKREYPLLSKSPAAEKLSSQTFDLCEYLMLLHKQGKLARDFVGPVPRQVAYHLPCHLKAQNIGYKSRDLLRLLPGAQVELVDRCSGMDGTWGVKSQFYSLSSKIADRLVEEARRTQPEVIVSDCSLAALQIEDRSGLRPLHPVEVLCRAYGLETPPQGKSSDATDSSARSE